MNFLIQPRLMASGFVGVNNAVTDGAIQYRYGRQVGRLGSRVVASGERSDGLFDGSPHRLTLTGIVRATDFCLTGAFFSLGTISHGKCFLE